MEIGEWRRDDSDANGESTDSDGGMHDENCAGCLRIVKAEEERRIGSWSEERVEVGLDVEVGRAVVGQNRAG
ncbi:uncharacterized protein DNG_07518 [Cephalotrichum gorgonifer]|uniref:Uncharacterized protein n=1 Tax=Cephalotrichum gorgonifer TaxID=2041049 RepID=A0AAE8N3N4_9PEZI|nr:uncharacterized protein DNG_07518 [Cephalotrichum gorgonifer]